MIPVLCVYALPTSRMNASADSFRTILTVHPPKPAPVIREPIQPSVWEAISNIVSSSGPVTSYRSRIDACASHRIVPKAFKLPFSNAETALFTRAFSKITCLTRSFTLSEPSLASAAAYSASLKSQRCARFSQSEALSLRSPSATSSRRLLYSEAPSACFLQVFASTSV